MSDLIDAQRDRDRYREGWLSRGRQINALEDAIFKAVCGRIPSDLDPVADVLKLGRALEAAQNELSEHRQSVSRQAVELVIARRALREAVESCPCPGVACARCKPLLAAALEIGCW